MAIVYYVGGKIVGLQADTKPLSVPENSTFIESDTQTEFIFVAGVWEPIIESFVPDFIDDFSTDQGWSQAGAGTNMNVNTGQERMDCNWLKRTTVDLITFDLQGTAGITPSETLWTYYILGVNITASTNTSASSNLAYLGLRNINTGSSETLSDEIMAMFVRGTTQGGASIRISSLENQGAGSAAGTTAQSGLPALNDLYYIKVFRLSATLIRAEYYSDEFFQNQIGITADDTITSGINGLRYLFFNKRDVSANGGTLAGNIDEIQFFNGVQA